MKTVSAREANQAFSRLLAEVVAGEEVVITRRGRRVARLVPYTEEGLSPERQAAAERLLALLRQGFALGDTTSTRNEWHER